MALHKIFSLTNNKRWMSWIENNIVDWTEKKCVDHHLASFGGAGTLNNIYFCEDNEPIKKEIIPWINKYYSWVKDLSFKFALEPNRDFSKEEVFQMIPHKNGDLYKFLSSESEDKPYNIRKSQPLVGKKCGSCGFEGPSHTSIDYFVLGLLMPEFISEQSEKKQLNEAVEIIMTAKLKEFEPLKSKLLKDIMNSDLKITDKPESETCPNCGTKEVGKGYWLPNPERSEDWKAPEAFLK